MPGWVHACAFFNVNLFPETDHERARTLPEHDVQTKPPGRPLSFKPEGDGLTGQWFIPFSAPLRTLSQFPTVIVNPHKGIRPPFNVNDWMIQGSLPTTHASAFFGVGRPSPEPALVANFEPHHNRIRVVVSGHSINTNRLMPPRLEPS